MGPSIMDGSQELTYASLDADRESTAAVEGKNPRLFLEWDRSKGEKWRLWERASSWTKVIRLRDRPFLFPTSSVPGRTVPCQPLYDVLGDRSRSTM